MVWIILFTLTWSSNFQVETPYVTPCWTRIHGAGSMDWVQPPAYSLDRKAMDISVRAPSTWGLPFSLDETNVYVQSPEICYNYRESIEQLQ